MRRLLFVLATLALLVGGTLAAGPAAQASAPGGGAATSALSCPQPFTGNRALAPAGSWFQTVYGSVCPPVSGKRTVGARLKFEPCCGFAGANVTDCTAYITLYHVGGSSSVKTLDCTYLAQHGGGSTNEVTWSIGSSSGTYEVRGYAIVKTAVTYNGSGNYSYTSFVS